MRGDRSGAVAGALERHRQLVSEAIGIRWLAGERARVGAQPRRRSGPAARGSRPAAAAPRWRWRWAAPAATAVKAASAVGEVVLPQRDQTAVVAHVAGERRACRARPIAGTARPTAESPLLSMQRDRAGEVAEFGRDGDAGGRRQPVAGQLGGHRIVRRRAQAGNAFELLALGPRLPRAEHDRNRHRSGQAHGAGPAARGGRRGPRVIMPACSPWLRRSAPARRAAP